jgi:hypothetical protein
MLSELADNGDILIYIINFYKSGMFYFNDDIDFFLCFSCVWFLLLKFKLEH